MSFSAQPNSLVLYSPDPHGEKFLTIQDREIQKIVLIDKPEIELLLKDGRHISGVLDSVTDSSLIIFRKNGSTGIIGTDEIRQIVFKGDSKILDGMGVGLLVGAGTGAILGLASGDDQSGWIRFSAGEKALVGGIVLGGAGLLVGTAVGVVSSTGDKEIEISADRPFTLLQPLVRNSIHK